MTEADQDRQNAMRDRGYGDLEQRLWAIIDRDGLGDVPSDIVGAVARLAAIAAQVERDQAVFATAITEAEQAAARAAWREAFAEATHAAIWKIHDAGLPANHRNLDIRTRLAGAVKTALDVLATKPPQQVPPPGAMERAREVVDRFPVPEEFDAKICLVEEVAAAITETEQAARAEVLAEAEAIVEWGQETYSTETEYPFLTARKHGNSAGLAYARAIRALAAAKPPPPQKPEE